eukprot:3647135-Rhodomonas_salina.1
MVRPKLLGMCDREELYTKEEARRGEASGEERTEREGSPSSHTVETPRPRAGTCRNLEGPPKVAQGTYACCSGT